MSAAETAAVRPSRVERIIESVRLAREMSPPAYSLSWPIEHDEASCAAARILALYDITATSTSEGLHAQWAPLQERNRADQIEALARSHQAQGYGPDLLVTGCNHMTLTELTHRGYRIHQRSNGDTIVSWGHACR